MSAIRRNWVRNGVSLSQKVFITREGIQLTQTHTHQASPVAVLLLIVFLYCQLKSWSSALQCTYWNLPLFSKRLRSPSHTDPGSGPSHPGHDSDTGRPDFGLKESEKERLSSSGPVRRRVRWYWPGGATHGASIEPWDGLIYMLTEHGRFPYSQRDKPTANKPLSERLGWQLLSPCSPPPRPSSAQRQGSKSPVKQFLVVCQDIHCLCHKRWGVSLAVKSSYLWLLRHITFMVLITSDKRKYILITSTKSACKHQGIAIEINIILMFLVYLITW